MSRRELTDKYAGQVFGWTWSLLHPLILICVYVFVFSVVFKQPIGRTDDFPMDYTAYILIGISCWLNIQDSISRSTSAITSRAELVKQVVFPLEILPVKSVLASFYTMTVSLSISLLYIGIQFGVQTLTLILAPLAIMLQFLFLVGTGLILSAFAVFIRDTKDVIQVVSFVGVYVIPAFYLPTWIPSLFSPILVANPFSHFVWCFQDAFFYARVEHPWSWIAATTLAILSLFIGTAFFARLRHAFGTLV